MTETESQAFIEQVIKGFWPEWTPTNAEYKVWMRKLTGYEYYKAERALGDWLAEQDMQGKYPKMGKIFTALSVRKAYIVAIKPEPIKMFELYDQDNPIRKQAFFVGSEKELKKRPAESYEQESEVKRQKFNELYEGRWIVIQDWKRHFEPAMADK